MEISKESTKWVNLGLAPMQLYMRKEEPAPITYMPAIENAKNSIRRPRAPPLLAAEIYLVTLRYIS